MKVIKVITNDRIDPVYIEAYNYREESSLVNFYVERSDHNELVASFNKMKTDNIILIAEFICRSYDDPSRKDGYEYIGTDTFGEDAEEVARINRA